MNNNERALHTFIGETNTAHDRLTALLAHIDDHSGIAPEDVTWGHVGSSTHVNELLGEIMEFLGLHCE
ncbi:MAG: hypothetical protein LBG83_03310 [Oscillospiraceae bacterium]|jgi:hypothetical protein|nr:hypothetical protein [Oscillospiraceae bacterium]